MKRARQFGTIAAMAALLVVAASCSSDDNGVEAGGGNQTEQTDGASATTAASGASGSDAPATTAAQTDGSDAQTTPSFSGEGGEQFCALLQKFDQENPGGDLASDADYNELIGAMNQLQDAAPKEIDSDVDTVAENLKAYADLYKKYGYDGDKAEADPKSEAILGDQDFAAASDRLDAYTSTVCGLGS